jgi:hypothetical protein|tara:strand:+ start:13041 stop:13205 length:165 start_codon:yes stop_codon:yes gene_type:complete
LIWAHHKQTSGRFVNLAQVKDAAFGPIIAAKHFLITLQREFTFGRKGSGFQNVA